jgi:opacity protein-like surface antigen
VFASTALGKSKGQQNKDDVIESQANMFGAKVFSTSWLFLGAGYGQMKQDIEAEGSEISTSNPVLATGLGVEFPAFGNWYFNASVWYSQVFIKKTEQLESNSYSEGISAYLGLSWSPPSTVVTQVFK